MTARYVTAPGSWLPPALLSHRCCLSSRCCGSSWMKVGKGRRGFSHWSRKEQGLGRWKIGVGKQQSSGPSLQWQNHLALGTIPGDRESKLLCSMGWLLDLGGARAWDGSSYKKVHLPPWLFFTADLCWKFTWKLRKRTQPLSQKLREPGSGAGLWWQVLMVARVCRL